MINKDFEQENNKLFQTIISPFFTAWKNEDIYLEDNQNDMRSKTILEIIITASCNQKCDYCYLTQHGEELYPSELRNNTQIINNLKLLLDYFYKNEIKYIPRLDIFSGEIWGWPLGNKVFDVILSYLRQHKIFIKRIVIPTNASFIIDERTTQVIRDYIQSFKELDTTLVFSISYDGKVVDNLNRPFKIDYDKTQDDYELRLRKFAKEFNYGWHPMISASTIEYQKENYDHWVKIIKEDYPDNYPEMFGYIMQLEVRNDDWTDDKIYSYLDWLNYLIDTDIHVFFKDDLELFFNSIVATQIKLRQTWGHNTYFPYCIGGCGPNLGCTLGMMLCIRLGDLAISPCHRTSYPKLLLGQFKVENEKIVDIVGKNIPLTNSIYVPSFAFKPGCDVCPNGLICLRSCLGSSFETNGELFDPVISNCHLQKAKTIFLYEKYCYMYPEKKEDISLPLAVTYNKLEREEGEFVKKWKKEIMRIINP